MDAEDEIRAVLARMSELANRRDVQGLMDLYLPEATGLLFGERLTLQGIREHCAQGYVGLLGAFNYELTPWTIEAGSGLAWVVGAERIEGATQAGPFASTIHATYCLKKTGGRWRIAHQHLSMHSAG